MDDVDVQDVQHCLLLYSLLVWLMPVQNEIYDVVTTTPKLSCAEKLEDWTRGKG